MSNENQPTQFCFTSKGLDDTQLIGEQISEKLVFPSCVYLKGAMGAGKTTLAKSIIAGFGYKGDVTSPTYNLVQEYSVELGTIYHMDLFRLADSHELEYLAIEDLWSDSSLFLIEWPERGAGYLQAANALLSISNTFKNKRNARDITLKLVGSPE